jgi:Family of unknown function (DUF6338)
MLPTGLLQVITVIVFVIPGAVFQNWRSRLRGPTPDQVEASTRLLRAIAVSGVLMLVYAIFLGRRFVKSYGTVDKLQADPRGVAVWGLLLLFVVPTALALLEHIWTIWRRRELQPRHPIRTLTAYDPVPSVWDYAIQRAEPSFVRVLMPEGRWIGGWLGEHSFMSSFPEARELFVSFQWHMNEAGAFVKPVEGSRGVWIRCDDARAVEFVAAPREDKAAHGSEVADLGQGKEVEGGEAVDSSP